MRTPTGASPAKQVARIVKARPTGSDIRVMAVRTPVGRKARRLTAGVAIVAVLGTVAAALAFRWPILAVVALLIAVSGWWVTAGGRLDPIPWMKGRDGERDVAARLEVLRSEGFEIFHGLRIGRGDVDHVVVGPTGVFVLETKAWSRISGPGAEERLGEGAKRTVRKAIGVRGLCGGHPFVHAVVVMAGAGSDRPVRPLGGATVVGLESLVGFIRSRPASLSPRDVHAIRGRIAAHAERVARSDAVRQRIGWAMAAVATIACGALAFALFGRDPCSGVLQWDEAMRCVGRRVIVMDRVVSYRVDEEDHRAYLNLGNDFAPDLPRLAIVVDLDSPADESWEGRIVRVEGTIREQPGYPLAVEISPEEGGMLSLVNP